eukprot:355943-Chlamydomonas_euryale.AAC.7
MWRPGHVAEEREPCYTEKLRGLGHQRRCTRMRCCVEGAIWSPDHMHASVPAQVAVVQHMCALARGASCLPVESTGFRHNVQERWYDVDTVGNATSLYAAWAACGAGSRPLRLSLPLPVSVAGECPVSDL